MTMLPAYSISISRNPKFYLLKNGHLTEPSIGLPRSEYPTFKNIALMLNEQDKMIKELTIRNKYLEWYCEELEAHVDSKIIEKINELYNEYVKKRLIL